MHIYRRPKPIFAMSFDLDDTLYDNRPVIRRVESELLVWLHHHHPATRSMTGEDWLAVKRQQVELNLELKHDVTLWRFRQLEAGFLTCGYKKEKAKQAAELGLAHALFLRNQVDVPELSHRVLAELAQKIPLVALTNGNVDAEKIGVAHYFHHIFMAGRDGLAKPHADMFEKSAAKLAISPENILHVGDHVRTDVMGSKQNGFQACWFNDQQRQLHKERRVTSLPDIEINCLSELLALI